MTKKPARNASPNPQPSSLYNKHSDAGGAISSGTVHKMPEDLKKALASDQAALAAWEDITPLARNEWICWVVSVKRPETRLEHVERTRTELKEGKRRPCCWAGCRHR